MTSAIKNILKSTPTPFYLFDEKGFVENYKTLETIFQNIYPNYHISYSYKTNYTPFICNLVKELGGYAEVVSDMEYELAKRLGYPNNLIVYNGPSKGIKIYEHLENGGILNLDSLDETLQIVNYCRQHPYNNYSCGIRINVDLNQNFISRFGFEKGSEELSEAISIINNTNNLRLSGLHCHISRCRSKDAWAQRSEFMISMADRYIDGIPDYISLGSGMFADMPEFLKEQFGGDAVPTYKDYAYSAIKPFKVRYSAFAKKPILFTEPGTTLVARYIDFVTKVLSIKKIKHIHIANLDGSYQNLGEICTLKKLPVKVISGRERSVKYPYLNLMGYTCLEQDMMYEGFTQPLAKDDIIVFENVGGYSIVEKPPFIKPQCPMYTLQNDGTVKLIMRAETFDDIFDKFVF